MARQIGFSTGAFYKFLSTKESLFFLRQMNSKIVELCFVKPETIQKGWLDEITASDLESFEYIAVHAPVFPYGSKGTDAIFEKITKLNELRKVNVVVFHPDTIENFEIFHNLPFPIAFENMDCRKTSFKKLEEIKSIIRIHDAAKIVLDINHIYTNDPTMRMASYFYDQLGLTIAHIHLSGYDGHHDPMYQTKQNFLIHAIRDFSHPIIIESVISPEEAKPEIDYITKVLSQNN